MEKEGKITLETLSFINLRLIRVRECSDLCRQLQTHRTAPDVDRGSRGSFRGSRFHLPQGCKCCLMRHPTSSASEGCLQTLSAPHCSILDKNYRVGTTQFAVGAAASSPPAADTIRSATITASCCTREGWKRQRGPNPNSALSFSAIWCP